MVCIAVVEDDERVLDAIRLLLEVKGWVVRAYTGGEAFLADLERHPPSCLILDPHLKGISGAEVARVVLSKSPIPIICLTAQPDSPITDEVKRLGVQVVLTKPVSADTLTKHVQEVLSNVNAKAKSDE